MGWKSHLSRMDGRTCFRCFFLFVFCDKSEFPEGLVVKQNLTMYKEAVDINPGWMSLKVSHCSWLEIVLLINATAKKALMLTFCEKMNRLPFSSSSQTTTVMATKCHIRY